DWSSDVCSSDLCASPTVTSARPHTASQKPSCAFASTERTMAHMRIKADEARRSRKGIFLGGFTCMLLCAACSTTQLAVSTQAEVMELAFPSIEEQTDYD